MTSRRLTQIAIAKENESQLPSALAEHRTRWASDRSTQLLSLTPRSWRCDRTRYRDLCDTDCSPQSSFSAHTSPHQSHQAPSLATERSLVSSQALLACKPGCVT
ncbi:hypothetical protein ElyMa_000033500 [Elysia marginata]|uniref:Uncharacterized protein n=1 Tax=Elysia marginata TaxID=1093978 RepID=A0AAV4EDH2_9GAST|nr:hypothetical protein ElyMa_000033500 [Elysia marginata]